MVNIDVYVINRDVFWDPITTVPSVDDSTVAMQTLPLGK